jgi:hypothetical protein
LLSFLHPRLKICNSSINSWNNPMEGEWNLRDDPFIKKNCFKGILTILLSEGKFLVKDQSYSNLVTFSYIIRRELFSKKNLVTSKFCTSL